MITRIWDIAAAALDAAMRPSAHPSITADQTRAAAARLSPDTAARSMIAEALGLPTDSTTGAIVVAIRGLRETAEQGRPAPAGAPSFHTFRSWLTQAAEDVDSGDATSGDALRALSAALADAQPWSEEPILAALYSGVATDAVEVAADQVSLPVGAAVNAREEIDRLRADLGRAGATAEWVWDPRAELPTPDEFDEIIANRAGKGITYAFAPAAVRPLLAEVHLQRSAVEVLRLDNERLRMERHGSWSNPPSPTDWSRLLQAMARIETVVGTEGRPSAATAHAVEVLRAELDMERLARDETRPHARGPVSVPWTDTDRQTLAKALCRSEGAHPSWDSLAGTGERQSYLAQARWLLDDGWRHLDAIMQDGFGPATPADVALSESNGHDDGGEPS